MNKFFLTILAFAALQVSGRGEVAANDASPAAEVAPEASVPDDGVRVAVLGYHDFSETAPETAMRIRTSKFRKQMEVIQQLGITVITYDDFMAWKKGEKEIPEKSILLTFDDGWKSVYTDAFPILKEFHYPFTLFLYKNYIDGGGKALTTPMIEEMIKAGASIGSHSTSHPFPSQVKAQRKKGERAYDAFLRQELGESKRFLESKFHLPVTAYAYPGGFFTDEMLTLADEFRYTYLFTVQPGKVKRGIDDKTLPRYMILGNYDKIFEFATTFREATTPTVAASGGITGLVQTTPYPVTPDAGMIVNTRLPTISADLSTVPDLDPATLSMRVGGFGLVPAKFDPATKQLSWTVNRRLRQSICQISVSWKDTAGKPPETPLRWSFQIDRTAAYMPDSE
ncbi:polysaccharide deacetylase family protein [Luteolibacter pohnpeiensis]|uniref:Polysaccharide deacetylase family protein n=1 Tax=Luteolibacter pohnpeiensis TaxID=454153 RepID=A0A934S847_9BACT|nr:polysaccharide deacetylase family protein [Luteolibacter pohnpeiensis]MBK1882571.1 polysaccharide deacetylase family protein [Luteolibacter pohnpeiensis]